MNKYILHPNSNATNSQNNNNFIQAEKFHTIEKEEDFYKDNLN